MRDLVQHDAPDLPLEQRRIVSVESLERTPVNGDPVRERARVIAAASSQRNTLVEAEESLAGWRVLFDDDVDVRHLLAEVGWQNTTPENDPPRQPSLQAQLSATDSSHPRPQQPQRSFRHPHVERVIVKTLEEQPKDATHWSTRSMADATGMSQSAVSRIWRAFALKPHQTEAFKLHPDPQFIDKVRDIVGLYLNPPEAAVVLCVDEKAQIQALDRSAPILPLMPGVAERRSHDYVRNGTTNLYAALDVALGQVLAEMTPRHRAEEFRRFLNLIEASVPAHLDVHVVLDNSSTHKTPSIQRWLVRHPRFTLHFTPTHGSWLNLVERWFAELTTKWIKRGSHRSVRELVASIRTWIANWNDNPKPFVWHKSADEILEGLAAYCQRINDSGH
jgi:DDE superfamily endonuclease